MVSYSQKEKEAKRKNDDDDSPPLSFPWGGTYKVWRRWKQRI
jgi:hypothetical protein